MSAQDFLVEIGTEELPPKALNTLSRHFADTVVAELAAAGLPCEADAVQVFATPRRLAVWVKGLAARQPERSLEKQGPFVAQAFGADGTPTPAALGFAKSNGVDINALQRVSTDKGERLVHRSVEPGSLTVELLPVMVEKALHALPIPRRMRWGSRRVEFVRPVHWLVMLYGAAVVDCDILGQRAGRNTRGHRFHAGDAQLSIGHPADYQPLLREHNVEACFRTRSERIVDQIKACAVAAGGQVVIDPALLEEVTALVEWPVALMGRFDPAFLQVPSEALISSMSEHQKYFHVVDAAGSLMPCFITVSNIESRDPARVVDGNERVIRPRLADAAFFYQTDCKTTLASRRDRLKTLVFQAQLGSVYDKTDRVAALAAHLAQSLAGNAAWAQRAGELSKADLLSNMVLEFDSMQGIAGSYYAARDGEPAEVATAIREQYLPRFAGDDVAATLTGRVLAIADRIDTLVGIIGLGQLPTGSKDPFALRRASIGVLNTLIRAGLDVDLAPVVAFARAQYRVTLAREDADTLVLDYVLERLRGICMEEGVSTEAFLAVQAKKLTHPLDIYRRVQAVHHFASLPEANALAAANKRVSNLLAGAAEAGIPAVVDAALLVEPAEQQLAEQLAAITAEVTPLLARNDYQQSLTRLAGLREAVDTFFDAVMVMTDDLALRGNRLALLSSLRALFLHVADVAQLVPDKNKS